MIRKCACRTDKYGNDKAAKYQDKKYGKQKRVFNPIIPKAGETCRCTVCGKTQ